MKTTEEENRIRIDNLGPVTKKKLKQSGKSEPPNKGYFPVKPGLKVAIPVHVKDLAEWEERMRQKYGDYHDRVAKSLLTGAAKSRKGTLDSLEIEQP
jgi:hypothetical protein